MDKKKAEVGRRRRYLGKMEKAFRGKLVLLGCLVLAIIPSIAYADYYAGLKVEIHPVEASTDVTRGVPFQIKVVALEQDGDQINATTTADWDDARYADIKLVSTDPNAQIYNGSTSQWVSMNPAYETILNGAGYETFDIVLNTIGEDKRITAGPGGDWGGDFFKVPLILEVHEFVHRFEIEIEDPGVPQKAGESFNIIITAIYTIDSIDHVAETFNDDVDIWAVIPDGTYRIDMDVKLVEKSSFTDGVANVLVEVYGSHPESRLVKIKCRNRVPHGGYYAESKEMHGGYYAEGESSDFIVNPNEYANILLLVPGEEHRYGRFDHASGKEGLPDPHQTAGVAITDQYGQKGVKVYTTDKYWNPLPASIPMTFSSSDLDPRVTFDGPVGTTIDHAQVFIVTLYTTNTNPGHSIKVSDGTRESVSIGIIVNPNDVVRFEFRNEIPKIVQTTDLIDIDIIAYDASDNIATGYSGKWADLKCIIGERYITPDRIQFTEGEAHASFQITKKAIEITVTVTYGDIFVESNPFTVIAGPYSRLLVLLEEEKHDPGWGDGKSLTPTSITAGESTTVTIIACDEFWNKKKKEVVITDISGLRGGYIVPPSPLPVLEESTGEAQCQVTFRTAGDQAITVTGDEGEPGISSSIVVNPGPFDRLVLVVPDISGGGPGEQLDPGTIEEDRKSGSPPTVTAGVPFDLIVAATDYYGNPVDITSEFPDTLRFYAWDGHDEVQFAGRKRLLPVDMETPVTTFRDNNILITLAPPSSPQPVRVYGYIDGRYIGYTEVSIPVTHGPLDHYAFSQIPNPLIAGETIENFTITAKDEFNNTYDDLNGLVWLKSNNDVLTGEITVEPRLVIFNDGVATCNLQVFKAGENVRLRVEYGWWWSVSRESGEFEVIAGRYKKLILRLLGEDLKPGDMTLGVEGKSGDAFAHSVDNSLPATVYAVDAYWNPTNPTDYNQKQPSIYIYTEEPSHYMQEVVPQTMVRGKTTFSLTLKTAATWWGLIAEDENYPEINNSSKINVKPGAFTKLQILAPGENPEPGTLQGKSMGMRPQKAGVYFDLVVRAVDQYWNLVDEDRSDEWVDEWVELFSEADLGLEDRLPPNGQQFDVGVTTFTIYLNWNNGDPVDVTATSVYPPPNVYDDTVNIPVERGYHYDIDMPLDCTAGMTFSMTVTLKDEHDNRVMGAKNRVWMRPCLPDYPYPDATNPDGLEEDGGDSKPIWLNEGQVTFDQSYDTVEKIRIKVYDEFDRVNYSDPIDVRASSLKYEVVVPPEVRAGDKFEMTVKLIDTGTGIVVPSKGGEDETVNLVALFGGEKAKGYLDVNSGVVLTQGEATITKQYYTKAETIEIRAFDDESWAEESQLASLVVLPGKMAWLQILAPGEEGKWGEWEYQGKGGKYSDDLLPQDIETRFSIKVYAVDQYWNVVDYDGGTVYLTSEPPGGSFDSDPVNLPFENGKIEDPHFWVTIHEAGSYFTLKAKADDLPPDVLSQPVTIKMEAAEYRITSGASSASTGDSFLLEVELVSAGVRKDGADNQFILTPLTVNYEQAPGKLTITEGTLVDGLPVLSDGYAELQVNYDTAGKIYIKVSDSSGHSPDYTDQLIDIEPVGLKYQVIAPEEVEAGKDFSLTVRLVDSVRETLVAPEEYDSNRQVELVAYSFPDESLAEGELKIKNLYLEKGEKTIPQSYNLAHKIYIVASDAPVSDPPDPPSTPERSGVIKVIGTPKTVMKLDGVYNEMNGALYLRGSTLIKIECISEIRAEKIFYRDNDSEEKTYEEPFRLSPGAHIIEYWGVDKYEHAEQVNKSKTIYVSFFSEGVDGVSNQPNPFKAGREETLILYDLKQPSNVTITIYDLLGQEVWRESYAAGENGGSTANNVSWDGRNLSGKVVANGGYICRIWIQGEKRHMVRKIAVAK